MRRWVCQELKHIFNICFRKIIRFILHIRALPRRFMAWIEHTLEMRGIYIFSTDAIYHRSDCCIFLRPWVAVQTGNAHLRVEEETRFIFKCRTSSKWRKKLINSKTCDKIIYFYKWKRNDRNEKIELYLTWSLFKEQQTTNTHHHWPKCKSAEKILDATPTRENILLLKWFQAFMLLRSLL